MNTETRDRDRLRAVFDTNILISALIYGGSPWLCLRLVIEGKIELIASRELLTELARVLEDKFEWPHDAVDMAVRRIVQHAHVVAPTKRLRVICSDPTDNRVLEAAVAGSADFIVSGDKRHILPLKTFREIVICSAAEFLKSYAPYHLKHDEHQK